MPNSFTTDRRGIMVNVLDSDVIVNELELQSHCYVYFWTNALEKGMNPLITSAMD